MSVQLAKSSNLRQMNHVSFPMSVQLLNSSNLRQMNHVLFPMSVQLFKSSSLNRWIMSIFPCPFSLWSHQISDRWIMSVQLLKSSNLTQINHVRSACEIIKSRTDESCPFSFRNLKITDRWIMSVFTFPFSFWNRQISHRWIMSVYTLVFWRPIFLFHSHFRLRLRCIVDVFAFPQLRGLLCCTLLGVHLFHGLKEIYKHGNALLVRQLLRHMFCAYSLDNTLQALT